MDVSFIMDKSGKKRRKFMFIKEFVEKYNARAQVTAATNKAAGANLLF